MIKTSDLFEIVPQKERYHVSTIDHGICVNAEAVRGPENAAALCKKLIAEVAQSNHRLKLAYEEELRALVTDDETASDQIPTLVQFTYNYRVEPCNIQLPALCVACLDANFIGVKE